jgi:hypothetical protein
MGKIPAVPKDHELKQTDWIAHESGGDATRQYRLLTSQSVVVVVKNIGAFVNVSVNDSDAGTVTDDLPRGSRLNAQLTKFHKEPVPWLITVTVTNRQGDLGPPTSVWVEIWALPVDSPPPPPEPRKPSPGLIRCLRPLPPPGRGSIPSWRVTISARSPGSSMATQTNGERSTTRIDPRSAPTRIGFTRGRG